MDSKGKSRISTQTHSSEVAERNGDSEVRGAAAAAGISQRERDWAVQNRRRISLIIKQFSQGLDPEEESELGELQAEADRHLDAVAPLPFERLQALEEQAGLPAAEPAGTESHRSDGG